MTTAQLDGIVLPARDGSTAPLVVNLFGGPGSGKSTLAASLFSDLKACGIEAACPDEPAKVSIWSGCGWKLDEQVIIMGQIWDNTCALRAHVDVIICDSPILLCSAYGTTEPDSFHRLVRDLHTRSRRMNLMVARPAQDYTQSGRRETLHEAERKDRAISDMLFDLREPAFEIPAAPQARRAARDAVSRHIQRVVRDGDGAT